MVQIARATVLTSRSLVQSQCAPEQLDDEHERLSLSLFLISLLPFVISLQCRSDSGLLDLEW